MANLTLLGFIQEIYLTFINNYEVFLNGLWGTLTIATSTVLCGSILGSLIALLKLSTFKILRFLASVYIEFLRGTPLLVQLYIARFFIPIAIPMLEGYDAIVYVMCALILNSSAYVAEIIRSGIQSVDKGQSEAAKSLGMGYANMMFRIILPQAIKNILPALGNELVTMIKETSLASVFFINELMLTRTLLMSSKFLSWQPLFVVAIIYLMVTLLLSKGVKMLEGKLSISD